MRALFFLLLASSLSAEEWTRQNDRGFRATATLLIDQIDRITIDLKLDFPSGFQPDFQALESQLVSGLDVRYPNFRLIETQRHSTKHATYFLRPLDAGSLPLSFLTIPFQSSSERVQLPSGLFMVPAFSSDKEEHLKPADPMSLAKIPPPELNRENQFSVDREGQQLKEDLLSRLQRKTFPWFELIFFLAGISLLATLGALYLRYRPALWKRKPEPEESPKIKALKALKALKKGSFSTREEVDGFYTSLTLTLREYIEAAYAIQAPEKTTEEFLVEMREHPRFPEREQQLLEQLLIQADQIKYAKGEATRKECGAAYSTAVKFLKCSNNSPLSQ